MTNTAKVILSCTDCPFNNQDNIYCRTCSIPMVARRAERRAAHHHLRERHQRKQHRGYYPNQPKSKIIRDYLKSQSLYHRIDFGVIGGLWVRNQ